MTDGIVLHLFITVIPAFGDWFIAGTGWLMTTGCWTHTVPTWLRLPTWILFRGCADLVGLYAGSCWQEGFVGAIGRGLFLDHYCVLASPIGQVLCLCVAQLTETTAPPGSPLLCFTGYIITRYLGCRHTHATPTCLAMGTITYTWPPCTHTCLATTFLYLVLGPHYVGLPWSDCWCCCWRHWETGVACGRDTVVLFYSIVRRRADWTIVCSKWERLQRGWPLCEEWLYLFILLQPGNSPL